ncbi:MAG: hypothetical protein HYR76_09405 [Ignavibacteria bacterium]|nr:hypothetical protein [Ignavibacteria bacterium]
MGRKIFHTKRREPHSLNRQFIALPFRSKIALFFFVSLASCVLHSCTGSEETKEYGPGTFSLTGTMQHTGVEHGCWQFIAADGESYELMGDNLNSLFHDKLHAELVVREIPDMMSTCMTGKVVEVLHIIHTSQ